LTYQYDKVGNVAVKTDNANSNLTESYNYDELNRLTSASATVYGNKTFSYDQLDNILQKDGYNYQYNSAKPYTLTNDGRYSYTYDANGSMIGRSDGRTLNWDYENRAIIISDGGSYIYNAQGQRIKKVDVGGTTKYYFFPEYEEEYKAGVLSKSVKYYFANKQRMAENSSTNGVRYYSKDHLGSSSAITDANGNLVLRTVNSPYGSEVYNQGTTDVAYKFTDKEKDNTGLNYFGARFYDPEVGRFISVDPKKAGMNWYVYCNNNPINAIDPDGRDIIVLNNSRAVNILGIHFGHNACLVGNDKTGWVYYSKYSTQIQIDDNRTATDNGNYKQNYTSVGAFGKDTAVSGQYDRSVRITTTADQDAAMIKTGNSIYDTKYDLATNNCADLVVDIAFSGKIDLYGTDLLGFGVYTIPNWQYDYANDQNNQNQGNSGTGNNGSSGTGGSGDTGGTTICCELFRQGLMNKDIFKIDEKFADILKAKYQYVVIGYQFWAKPVVAYMQKSKSFTSFVNTIAKPWTYEMAHLMDKKHKGNFIGAIIMVLGVPLCWLIGLIIINLFYVEILLAIVVISLVSLKLTRRYRQQKSCLT
jgi:RHS repeat-associated protein